MDGRSSRVASAFPGRSRGKRVLSRSCSRCARRLRFFPGFPTIGWAQSWFDRRWRISGGVPLRAFGRICRLTPAQARSKGTRPRPATPAQARFNGRWPRPRRCEGCDVPSISPRTPAAIVAGGPLQHHAVDRHATRRSFRCVRAAGSARRRHPRVLSDGALELFVRFDERRASRVVAAVPRTEPAPGPDGKRVRERGGARRR